MSAGNEPDVSGSPSQSEQEQFWSEVYGEARWKREMNDYIDSHIDDILEGVENG